MPSPLPEVADAAAVRTVNIRAPPPFKYRVTRTFAGDSSTGRSPKRTTSPAIIVPINATRASDRYLAAETFAHAAPDPS
jgi:hypothetical protein